MIIMKLTKDVLKLTKDVFEGELKVKFMCAVVLQIIPLKCLLHSSVKII